MKTEPVNKKFDPAAIIILVIVGIILYLFLKPKFESNDQSKYSGLVPINNTKTADADYSQPVQSAQSNSNIVKLNQPLTTQYFEVTVQRYWVLKSVNTDNEYTDLPQLPDIKYLVLRIKYKNTDTESRMILSGEVLINYNGRDYNFDHPETIFGNGWQTGLEQINPLTHLTTAVVYKIPKELKGTAYYHPGRSEDGQVIQIGEIK